MKNQENLNRNVLLQTKDKQFDSILEFASYYGFKYTTVNYHLKRGKTPDEIVSILSEALPSTTRYRTDSKRAQPCSYDGVTYPSITVAAESLGIPAHQVYNTKNLNGLTADEALKQVVESYKKPGYREAHEPKQRPVTVAGVTYPSKAAALKCYGMNYLTVFSRMERNHLTFEEAVLQGKKAANKTVADKTRQEQLSSLIPYPIEKNPDSFMAKLNKILEQNPYFTTCWVSPDKTMGAISFSVDIWSLNDKREVYILFPFQPEGKQFPIEMIIPTLTTIPEMSEKTETDILRLLNDINGELLNITAALKQNAITVSACHYISPQVNNIRTFTRSLHSFLGGATELYKRLH